MSPPLRLVIDTNVVMEMLHYADPRSRPLLAAIEDGRASGFTTGECLEELRRVLGYPAFALDAVGAARLMERYRKMVTVWPEEIGPPPRLPLCRDRDDQKFLVLAARAKADLLLTRDKELLRFARRRYQALGFGIVTPEGFPAP